MSELAMSLDAARDRLRAASPSPYITVSEAAKLAHVSEKSIRRACHSGALRSFKPTTRVLLREEDVHAWVQGHPVAPAGAPPSGPGRQRALSSAPMPPGSVAALRDMERQQRG